MSDIMEVFKDRRSIRSYADTPIPEDTLKEIIEGGYYSPNAGNRQYLRMVVCKNREINEYLGKLKRQVTEIFWYPEKFPEGTDHTAVKDEDLEGVPNSFYDAPVVVYLFSLKTFEFAEADSYIMANNLGVIARNFDVGSVIISVATDYFVTERSRQILADWGIPDTYSIRSHATLGYPKDGFPQAAPHDKYLAPLYVE